MTSIRRAETTNAASGPGSPTSKADRAYETILRSIRCGDYGPGERLVFERLARTLGTSVVPVREAIRRLEADGYVTFTRNIGATVRSIEVGRYAETVEAVAAIEGIALALAAPHLPVATLRQARRVNARLRAGLEQFDATEFSRLNRRFHELLFNACPNRHLLAILQREWLLLDTIRSTAFSFIPERAPRSVEEHDELLDLLEQGSPGEAIERFAREHRLSTARRLVVHLEAAAAAAAAASTTGVLA